MEDRERKALEVVGALPKKAGPEDYGMVRVEDPAVGDVVWTYSRGQYRRALVTKVGPKRVEVYYTTDGAVNDSRRSWEMAVAVDVEGSARRYGEQAGQNYDYVASVANGTAETYARFPRGEEEKAREMAEYAERLAKMGTREEYVARETARRAEELTRRKAVAREGGPTVYVNFTTKSTPRADVWKEA